MARKLTQHLRNEDCRLFCDLVIQVLIREGEMPDEAPPSYRLAEAEARALAKDAVAVRKLRRALRDVMYEDVCQIAREVKHEYD